MDNSLLEDKLNVMMYTTNSNYTDNNNSNNNNMKRAFQMNTNQTDFKRILILHQSFLPGSWE